MTALATPLLGETVGWRRWSAVVVGFVGILIIARPTAELFQLAALLPLGAASLDITAVLGPQSASRCDGPLAECIIEPTFVTQTLSFDVVAP